MSYNVMHEPEQHRFVSVVNGHETYLQYSRRSDGVLSYDHTFSPEAVRGRGIAGAVVNSALRWARESGYKIVPECWFVAAFIGKHPEYRDLVAE